MGAQAGGTPGCVRLRLARQMDTTRAIVA